MSIVTRLTLDGGYPDGVWKCAGCPARLGDNDLEGSALVHADDCTEMATIRRPAPGAACSPDDLAQVAYSERCRFLLASGIVPATWEQLQPGTRRMLALEAGAVAAAEDDLIRPQIIAAIDRFQGDLVYTAPEAWGTRVAQLRDAIADLLDGDS